MGGRHWLICCVDRQRWTRWPNSAPPVVAIALAWVLSLRGRKVLVGSKSGGRKSAHGVGGDRDTGLTPIFRCGMFETLFLREKVWGGHDVSMLTGMVQAWVGQKLVKVTFFEFFNVRFYKYLRR